MPYLKHDKTLYEISLDRAERFANYLDKNQRIPFGLNRLDPRKCELFEKLPYNYQDYEVIYLTPQIETSKPDYSS